MVKETACFVTAFSFKSGYRWNTIQLQMIKYLYILKMNLSVSPDLGKQVWSNFLRKNQLLCDSGHTHLEQQSEVKMDECKQRYCSSPFSAQRTQRHHQAEQERTQQLESEFSNNLVSFHTVMDKLNGKMFRLSFLKCTCKECTMPIKG